jgi:hypothetical protein
LLSPPLAGGAAKGNIEGRSVSAGFADALVLGDAPKLSDAVTDAGLGLSAGFAKVNEAADPVLVGPGAEAEATSGGAPNPTDLGSEDEAFFCSCNLALIFAIASASKSCFSHFEKVLYPRVGLSLAAVPPGANGLYADATRRLDEAWASGKASMRSPTLVAIDSRNRRRFGAGDSWAAADAQRRFLPFIDGES